VLRLVKAEHVSTTARLTAAIMPGVLGAFLAFLAGLIALK